MASNFAFLAKYWPDLAQIGSAAELYLSADPNACVYKIGLLAERVARVICAIEKIDLPEPCAHIDCIRALKHADLLPKRIDGMFYTLRKARNDAVHAGLTSRSRAQGLLELVFHLCCWLMEVYGDWTFTAPDYAPPEDHDPSPDFVERLQEQEARIKALAAQVEQIRTAASEADRAHRAEKATQVAQQLPIAPEEASHPASGAVRLDISALPLVNYALHHNRTAIVRNITIENTTDAPIENVDLQITATPAFALPFTRHIDYLPPHKSITCSNPKLLLDSAYLAATTEKLTGILHVELTQEDRVLATVEAETTVLAFDEWHGLGMYPELLASFVTPNHPALVKIIARATEYLGKWTGDTSMDAYQSQDSNRVLSQAAAIFAAIKEQRIAYAVPPASFEYAGQRVRLCDMVLQQKLGTCLDLTLLYASCLESVGLHPLLIVTEGHIFTGVWLEDNMFPECVQDDFSLVSKRLASGVNEIAVMETTAVTTGRDLSFDDARGMGERNLATQNPEYIIDVRRARMSHVSPLPQRVHTDGGWEIVHDVSINKDNLTAPTQLDETIQIDPNAQDQNLPKKVQWERKLLDLGLRNTLINLRLTKTQLPILTSSLDALENALTEGSDFTILPKPADWQLDDITFETLTEKGVSSIIQAEFENKRLRSIYPDGELTKIVKGLYRTAKTSLEENGANTLYLALGLLRWFETPRSTKPRYAPIILMPIEMVRKSANQGYVIRLRDEEPQMNITLLEKLKQDFGILVKGLDPLPEDEQGIDIRKVLTIMRKSVMEQTHWDVLETASIGIFSFSQFVMWNDIHSRTEDLMRSKVVRSLIDGQLCWDAQPLVMDDRVNENNVLLPMPADASQLYAIQAACNGESFVLHGPPGTGKSQTITSLIANALANGKRVLFVAEKMAALEVVQKRLDRIGIGPFCLELHSNKSKKKDVLEQLRQATEVTRNCSPTAYAQKAEQLAAARAELDGYAAELHRMLHCGTDLYTLINRYEHHQNAPDLSPFDRAFVRGLDKPALEQHQLLLERLIAAGQEVGHPMGHPLRRVACTQYTQNLRTGLRPAVDAYRAQLSRIRQWVTDLSPVFSGKLPESFEELQKFATIASHLVCWYDMPPAWSKTAAPQLYFEQIRQLAQQAARANFLEAQLLRTFDPGFLTQDGAALFAEYAQIAAKWFLPKSMGLRKMANTLSAYAKAPVSKDTLREHVTALRDYQQASRAAGALLQQYGKDLGVLYQGRATQWNTVEQMATAAQTSCQALQALTGSLQTMHLYGGDAGLKQAVFGLWQDFAAFMPARNSFVTLLDILPQTQPDWLAGELELCQTVLTHADSLKEWIAYVAAAEAVKAAGLAGVVDGYGNGIPHHDLISAYQKALLMALICDAIDETSTLNQFSGPVFNKKIEQYKRMDQAWTQLSQQEVFCRLASKIPDFTREAAHSSELGILQRCIKSGGRGVSIRKLFDQIPNLLSRLCPCMLMSPISAAQYLDPRQEPFDIVVFDEASQLPTCKAVGVMARGKDAVVVGDPKQMPPTAFFATNTVDEDNLEIEDLESILDDCLALNMPQSHLLWHYRSRHESLIAFSNSQFYDNKLLTFPSVNDRESKVRLIRVDGKFDRGKSRTNKEEAMAVVEEIKRRAKDPALSQQSLGVITFNISQQHLIDDLLERACAQDPELEKWVLREGEPLFIKNLENVQGDERDVILFSIGFGPDEKGKVYMNFGPLNRDGGWRRLNVAVSRARCEMLVFTTLRSEQLDLNRTQAEGVLALRQFLEYAEGRTLAVEETALPRRDDCDGIVAAICAALESRGYDADLSVGRSAYRIDIGVVDPRDPDRYILGILLDGTAYGTAKTTRDREISQIGVLNGLGWQILRVWSMDWWDNREKELERIFSRLEDLQKGHVQPEMPEPAPLPETPVLAAMPSAPVKTAPLYAPAILSQKHLSADDFISPAYHRSVLSAIESAVNAEAPVSLTTLTKRVVQSYGIQRAGSRIQGYMDAILRKMNFPTTIQDGSPFYWKRGQDPLDYTSFRVNGEGECRRDVRDVAVQEVANAICLVLYEQVSMNRDDLLRETANKLGYTRLGSNVLSTLDAGIRYAQDQGRITAGVTGSLVLTELGMTRAQTTLQQF